MNNFRYIIVAGVALMATANLGAITIDNAACVEMALRASRELQQSANAVEQAKLDKGIAKTAYLPNFAGSATGGWRLPDTDMLSMQLQLRGLYFAGINLTQPIYAGGKIVAANKLASIGYKAALEQQRLTHAQIVANAENAYWSYVAVLAKQRMMQSYKEQIDTIYQQTLTSVQAGMATDNDLLRIEARRSQIVYQLSQVDNGANLCRLSLCNMFDIDSETPIETTDKEVPLDVPVNLNDFDIYNRPEVRLLQSQVDAKLQQVNMKRAEFLPQIGLQAGWSAYGNIKVKGYATGADGSAVPFTYNSSGTGWTIMASLQVPLFHWGEGYKKVKRAKIDVDNAKLELDDKTRLMTLEVRQAISNVDNGRQMLHAAERAMEQADANLQMQTQRYNLGLASLTEQLEAQSQWYTSSSNLIEARTQLRIYYVEYQRVTGRL
jgi:outer membrane protein TolC